MYAGTGPPRRWMRASWAALGVFALASLARASSAPATTVDEVFPPNQSVCGTLPRAAGIHALHESADTILAPEELDSNWVPEDQSLSRDLQFLRWRNVRVRPISREFPFEVRRGTVGMTIHAEGRSHNWNIAVELFGPHGNLIACQECANAPAVGEALPGQGTTQMPSTDRPGWELLPGHYAFRVRASPVDSTVVGPGTIVDVLATLHTTDPVVVDKRLDLNFVYLPHSALSAEIAQSSPRFATFLAMIGQWLAPTGIRIGTVTHVNLDRPDLDVIATYDEAAVLFRTSRDVGRPLALNVYCLQGFEPPLNPVVGLSGGIPGPAINGTPESGIAIRTSPFFTCSDCLGAFASLTAHEIGHYLGFYHTTEADLEHFDPFEDTPECHGVGLNDCPDRDYVMFPLIHTANTIFSPHQSRMAWRHPIVQTVAVVGESHSSEPPAGTVVASPNPFAEEVRFAAPGPGGPSGVTIYDVAGRSVRHLTGTGGDVVWDGKDDAGQGSAAGIYFARTLAPGGHAAQMIRLVKVR